MYRIKVESLVGTEFVRHTEGHDFKEALRQMKDEISPMVARVALYCVHDPYDTYGLLLAHASRNLGNNRMSKITMSGIQEV